MSHLVTDCPRCNARNITFDIKFPIQTSATPVSFEIFCVCRNCEKTVIFCLSWMKLSASFKMYDFSLNQNVLSSFSLRGFISVKDKAVGKPPEYLPENIENTFLEGSRCLSVGCFNASAAMFRLTLDIVSKDLLPGDEVEGLNNRIRNSLGLRMEWLFKNNVLPNSLMDLSSCIKNDGNDGVHDGNLTKEEAEDLQDFTFILLERLYTEPKRIEVAIERRTLRKRA